MMVPVPFDTHLSMLMELIGEAKRTGYAKRIQDCHFIQVTDYRRWGGKEKQLQAIVQQSLHDLGWNGFERLILVGLSSVTRIRDRGNPVVELAPITIFPLPADDVSDLLLGFVDVTVHLNTDLLGLRFAERGMQVRFMEAPASHTHFLEARRGRRGFLMPAYVREQMLHELMTIETLIQLSDWILSSGMTREWTDVTNSPILGFDNERSTWAPAARIDLAS